MEEIAKVVKTVLQEQISERIRKQIVDVYVSQIVERSAQDRETPQTQTIQGTQDPESLAMTPVCQVRQTEIGEVRLERQSPQNPLHPYSSQHPSWKILQMLLGLNNQPMLQSTWRSHPWSQR